MKIIAGDIDADAIKKLKAIVYDDVQWDDLTQEQLKVILRKISKYLIRMAESKSDIVDNDNPLP